MNWAARRIPDREPAVLVPANPLKGVPRPVIPRSPERYAERDELAAFLRWAWRRAKRKDSKGRVSLTSRFDRQLCLLVRLAAHTGARPGELCITGRHRRETGFTWDRWEPDAHTNALGHRVGLITHQKHKTAGKTGRAREIVVPPILVRALERHRARDWAHPEWVFTHRRGQNAESRGAMTAAVGEPWTSHNLGTKIRKWRAKAIAEGKRLKAEGKPTRGLERIQDEGDNRFVLYRLRHTRITDLIGVNGGLSHDQAAALTGTSGKMIETTYGHLTGTRLIELDQAARSRRR
jgi:integrase